MKIQTSSFDLIRSRQEDTLEIKFDQGILIKSDAWVTTYYIAFINDVLPITQKKKK